MHHMTGLWLFRKDGSTLICIHSCGAADQLTEYEPLRLQSPDIRMECAHGHGVFQRQMATGGGSWLDSRAGILLHCCFVDNLVSVKT